MSVFIKTVYATDLETGECWVHEKKEVYLPGASGFSYTEDGIYYEGVFQTPEEAELEEGDVEEEPESFEIV